MKEVTSYFENHGWLKGRESVNSTCDESFYNRFSGYPECGTNPGKGILVFANVYCYAKALIPFTTVELHLVGQIRDEQWVDLNIYAIDTLDQIPVCCERLLKAWKTIHGVK